MGWPVSFRLCKVEDKFDARVLFGDDNKGQLDFINLSSEHPIVRVPFMHSEVALDLDEFEDGMNGNSD